MAAAVRELTEATADDDGIVDFVRRRLTGSFHVDPWGLDQDVHRLAAALAGLRWSVSIGGIEHVPADDAAVVVANQRPLSLSPWAAALALGAQVGRSLRFVGLPDVEPLGTLFRRLGGIVARPEELSGILQSGELALVWCEAGLRSGGRVGRLRPELMAPAVAVGAPVIPVAIHGHRLGRLLRVEVGAHVPRRRTSGPLAATELAESARDAVQVLLDEANPPRWPWS
jgi:hypothetical protein